MPGLSELARVEPREVAASLGRGWRVDHDGHVAQSPEPRARTRPSHRRRLRPTCGCRPPRGSPRRDATRPRGRGCGGRPRGETPAARRPPPGRMRRAQGAPGSPPIDPRDQWRRCAQPPDPGIGRRGRAGRLAPRPPMPRRAGARDPRGPSGAPGSRHLPPRRKTSRPGRSVPHHEVLPVVRWKPRSSTQARAPTAARTFLVLGGIDTARGGRRPAGRWSRTTVWPHSRRRRAAVAPAGPPPITATSRGGLSATVFTLDGTVTLMSVSPRFDRGPSSGKAQRALSLPSPMSLAAGTRLGPYEILAPLGAGGMGEVYRARDTRLGREVAVKVLPTETIASEEVRQRFEREAKVISQLAHPNICTLFDVGQEKGTDYIVMELLDGSTLHDRLTKDPFPLDQVLQYGAAIADALDQAHRRGIVHRDLKPGNVMLTKSGVKLLDFGLARTVTPALHGGSFSEGKTFTAAAAMTAEGTVLGTLQYMAPEQLEGKPADVRTDVFALGSLLYEMAAGTAGLRRGECSRGGLGDPPRRAPTARGAAIRLPARPGTPGARLPGQGPGRALAVGPRRQAAARGPARDRARDGGGNVEVEAASLRPLGGCGGGDHPGRGRASSLLPHACGNDAGRPLLGAAPRRTHLRGVDRGHHLQPLPRRRHPRLRRHRGQRKAALPSQPVVSRSQAPRRHRGSALGLLVARREVARVLRRPQAQAPRPRFRIARADLQRAAGSGDHRDLGQGRPDPLRVGRRRRHVPRVHGRRRAGARARAAARGRCPTRELALVPSRRTAVPLPDAARRPELPHHVGRARDSPAGRCAASDSFAQYVASGYIVFAKEGTLLAQRFDPEAGQVSGEAFADRRSGAVLRHDRLGSLRGLAQRGPRLRLARRSSAPLLVRPERPRRAPGDARPPCWRSVSRSTAAAPSSTAPTRATATSTSGRSTSRGAPRAE